MRLATGRSPERLGDLKRSVAHSDDRAERIAKDHSPCPHCGEPRANETDGNGGVRLYCNQCRASEPVRRRMA